MKKFDLQKALSGERVITRNGKEVTGLHLFDVKKGYCLYGMLDGAIHKWMSDGKYYESMGECDFDLCMPSEKKTMWVNVYKYGSVYHLIYPYNTKEEALGYSTNKLVDTIQITFEI